MSEFSSNSPKLPPDQQLYFNARELLARQWKDGTIVQIHFIEIGSDDAYHKYTGDLTDAGDDGVDYWFDIHLRRHVRQLRIDRASDPLPALMDDISATFGASDFGDLTPDERTAWLAKTNDALAMRYDLLAIMGDREELPVSDEPMRRYYHELGIPHGIIVRAVPK